jgi:glutamate---cysteine ligase / carboxylate-amine ligase
MEHRFGRAPAFALGVEEELLLLRDDDLGLSHTASTILPRVGATDADGTITPDTYEALAELATPIVRDAGEAVTRLGALRTRLRQAGATLAGAGIHPAAEFGDVIHYPLPRYRAIADELEGLLQRTPTCALHVHVGMPDPETAIRAYDHLRSHLPLLQGLAGASPFWFGRDSGLASSRATLFRSYPRGELPRAFASWDDYTETVAQIVAAAGVEDYTFLWWDLRPSPNLGTVEVRAMDAQSRLESVAGLAALVHALAAACADGAEEFAPPTEALMESSFRAARDGVDATVWWRGELRPIRQVGADALELARPYARELDGEDALEEIERILREGGGADRMREAHAAGGMDGILARLVAETYGSTQTTSPIRSQS